MIPIRSMLDAQLLHRALRCHAGLTQAQLAEKLGISMGQVHVRENANSGFGVDALARLAEVFGMQLVLVPRGDDPGCCKHCRRVTQLADAQRPHRNNMSFGTAWNALYDAVAKAVGRSA